MKPFYSILCLLIIIISCGKKEAPKEEVVSPIVKDSIVEVPEVIKEKQPEIIFTVQVAALHNENKNLESLMDVSMYQEDGFTKYRLGNFTSYEEALEYKKMVVNSFPDSFIQALKNDEPIHISKALQ